MTDAPTITIDLLNPLDIGGGRTASRVVLREPRMREYARFGEPISYVPDAEGRDIPVENDEAIEKYLGALVIEPDSPILLLNLRLVDAIRVKEALLSFFVDCRERAFRLPLVSSSSSAVTSAPPSSTT